MDYLKELESTPWLYSPCTMREEEHEPPEDPPLDAGTLWATFKRARKYVIKRMEPQYLDRAADLLEANFFNSDILCKGVQITRDRESVNHYKGILKCWMGGRTTLVAVEQGNGKVVGILISTIYDLNPKTYHQLQYSRICICDQRVQEIQDLRVRMSEALIESADLMEKKILEIKVLCADRVEIIADDIEKRLIDSFNVIAKEALVFAVTSVVTSHRQQILFEKEGFEKALVVKYDNLKKGDYILFPSKEPDTSVMGLYKLIDYSIDLSETCGDGSSVDPDEELNTFVDLYLYSESSSSSEESDSSYKKLERLISEYFRENEDYFESGYFMGKEYEEEDLMEEYEMDEYALGEFEEYEEEDYMDEYVLDEYELHEYEEICDMEEHELDEYEFDEYELHEYEEICDMEEHELDEYEFDEYELHEYEEICDMEEHELDEYEFDEYELHEYEEICDMEEHELSEYEEIDEMEEYELLDYEEIDEMEEYELLEFEEIDEMEEYELLEYEEIDEMEEFELEEYEEVDVMEEYELEEYKKVNAMEEYDEESEMEEYEERDETEKEENNETEKEENNETEEGEDVQEEKQHDTEIRSSRAYRFMGDYFY